MSSLPSSSTPPEGDEQHVRPGLAQAAQNVRMIHFEQRFVRRQIRADELQLRVARADFFRHGFVAAEQIDAPVFFLGLREETGDEAGDGDIGRQGVAEHF